MEKEKVLEIEFKEIWGKYAWRIVKNTIPFNVEEVHNDEVKLVRHQDNIYILDDFEGICDILDDEILIYEEDKIKIERFVTEINHKYGRPKRWRANLYENYYSINSLGYIKIHTEENTKTDDLYYDLGNYFKSSELAMKFRDTVWTDAFNKAKELNED